MRMSAFYRFVILDDGNDMFLAYLDWHHLETLLADGDNLKSTAHASSHDGR